VLPLARHPRIDSRVIVCDLDEEPDGLLALSPADIAERLYTPAADLPEGERRIPLKEIHTNKCPVLVPLAHLREADFERLGIDRAAAEKRALRLREATGLSEKVRRVFASEAHREPSDADAGLYDGFLADADRRLFPRIRASSPEGLREFAAQLRDPRCPQLLLRYRARNWPDSLDADERKAWNEYRRQRLQRDSGLSEYDFDSYRASIATLRAQHEAGPAQALLDALEDWGRQIESELAP